MQCDLASDLGLLGCSKADTWFDVQRAYRSNARALHRDLITKVEGAHKRFALVNAAYDRLKARFHEAEQTCNRPAALLLEVDTKTATRLQRAVNSRRFNLQMAATRDAATGIYGDPRRPMTRAALGLLSAHCATAIRVLGRSLEFEIPNSLGEGRNLIAIPDLRFENNTRLKIVSKTSVIDLVLAGRASVSLVSPSSVPVPLRDQFDQFLVRYAP